MRYLSLVMVFLLCAACAACSANKQPDWRKNHEHTGSNSSYSTGGFGACDDDDLINYTCD